MRLLCLTYKQRLKSPRFSSKQFNFLFSSNDFKYLSEYNSNNIIEIEEVQ